MSEYESKSSIRAILLTEKEYKDVNLTYKQAFQNLVDNHSNMFDKAYKCGENEIKMVAPIIESDGSFYNKYVPGNIIFVGDGKNIGIEIVLDYCYDSQDADLELSYTDLQEYLYFLCGNFGTDQKTIKVFSYSWYNGCDEPFNF